MTAIDLATLRQQTAKLADAFCNHIEFLKILQEILWQYTNHSYRRSIHNQSPQLVISNTPRPVIAQIERALAPLSHEYPLKAAILINHLWNIETLETKLLSASMIGQIPPNELAIPIFSSIPDRLHKSTDPEIKIALLTKSLARVRKETPDIFLSLLEEWLISPHANWHLWGLQAMIPFIKDTKFENLPSVLRMINFSLVAAKPETQMELANVINVLYQYFPVETRAFLAQHIQVQHDEVHMTFMSRIVPGLLPSLQPIIRSLLREELI